MPAGLWRDLDTSSTRDDCEPSADLLAMAESFGSEFTIVEVMPDEGSTTELWVALAKPTQAVTLVRPKPDLTTAA
ncbi:hypothetical protein XH81_04225 [Bradyrhizobium sp. CCBAU 25360]|nr:hypothetical protein [Bradyrhizobium sp. CCBAU 25360]